MKAIWNKQIIAESDNTISLENNQYFPLSTVNMKFLQKVNTHTSCPWKGEASYYNIIVENKINNEAAWYYADPKPMAKKIKNYIAFWKGVEIIE